MANGVELRSLRVAPEIDASKYTAGAQQKIAADKAMVAANQEVATTAVQTDAKISQSGDVLTRLSRQYVDGYASAQRFNSALNALSRGIETNRISMAQAGPILDGIYKRYGLIADVSQFAARGQAELATAITAANAKIAAQRQITPANDVGGVGGGARFRQQNLGFQLQDIGVSIYSGMPLSTTLIQQGSQILGIYGGNGGVNALFKDLAGLLGGVARVGGPVIGVLAGIYGAYKLLSSYSAEAALGIDAATEALAKQAAPVDSIEGKIKELVSIQTEYQKAITTTATAQQAASQSIVASTEREFNAKRQLLELELKRQEASIKLQQSELAISGLNLRKAVGQQVFTRSDLERQGYADPRINGGIPFVRLPDDVTGLQKTQEVLENNPLFDKIKELQANLQLTELGAERLREAVKKVFTDAGGLGGPTFEGGNIPIPHFRGVDDVPADQEFMTDFGKSSAQRIRDLQNQATALGLTGAALEAFTFKQQALNAAISQNIDLGPDQIAAIEKQAKAYGQAAEALARASLARDLQFERDQLFRSTNDQAIATRLRGAGLAVDLNSPLAQQMRQTQQFTDARDTASGFVKTFGNELINNGGDIGKALGKAILNALMDATQKAWEQLANQIGNALASAFFGSPGGNLSGAVGAGSGVVGAVLGAANDNYAAGAVTRSPLAAVGSVGSAYNVANATNFIQQYASAIGIDPDIALRVAKGEGLASGVWQSNLFRNGVREPSFGPFQLLKGGPGTGFGTGLGNNFMAKTGLDPADPANWQQSTAFALDQAKANGWGAWYGAKAQGITGFMGIDQSATKTVGALDKLTSSSIDTAQSLNDGLGKLGNSLSQFPAAPAGGASGGGGGLFGWLGGLFGGGGGLSSAFSGTSAYSWLSANPGGFIGLYHDGGTAGSPAQTRYAPYSMFRNAPRFHEGTLGADEVPAILKRGEPVFKSMEHARQVVGTNSNQAPGKTELHVHVYGGSGDDHIRRLSREGAQQAIAEKERADRRGGFGTTQRRFSSNKG